MSRYEDIELSIISHKVGPVSSKMPAPLPGEEKEEWAAAAATGGLGLRIGPQVLATHTFANAPPLDILLVPGGAGTRVMEARGDRAAADFIAAQYPTLRYLLTVCTGAALAATAGVLDGRRATSNKTSWDWVVRHGSGAVIWVPSARWVVDGNIWTSSGVAAGMDMVCAFLEHCYTHNRAAVKTVINAIEYAPHTDPDWDPFAIVHHVSLDPVLLLSLNFFFVSSPLLFFFHWDQRKMEMQELTVAVPPGSWSGQERAPGRLIMSSLSGSDVDIPS